MYLFLNTSTAASLNRSRRSDGTLITQRLHFAPMPCENRHILGWYRLIRELKDAGVGVICVFDGEERSKAKQREVNTSLLAGERHRHRILTSPRPQDGGGLTERMLLGAPWKSSGCAVSAV